MVKLVLNQAELNTILAQADSKLVVIDFYATWCGPCKMIAPQIEEFTAEYSDVVFLKVDVDEAEDVAAKYEISAMPTFVFIKNTKEIHRFSGANVVTLQKAINERK